MKEGLFSFLGSCDRERAEIDCLRNWKVLTVIMFFQVASAVASSVVQGVSSTVQVRMFPCWFLPVSPMVNEGVRHGVFGSIYVTQCHHPKEMHAQQ